MFDLVLNVLPFFQVSTLEKSLFLARSGNQTFQQNKKAVNQTNFQRAHIN